MTSVTARRSGLARAHGAALAFVLTLFLIPRSLPAADVREFMLPRAGLPSGVAVAPDGAVWISVMHADQLLRFDPVTTRFSEVALPRQTLPRSVLVDPRGNIWCAASGRGMVLRLTPGSSRPAEFALPSIAATLAAAPSPWALAFSARGDEIWVTVHGDGRVARIPALAEPPRRGFVAREVSLGDPVARPDGLAADAQGMVWIAAPGTDEVLRLSPADGSVRRVPIGPGSRPRGVAVGADGSVWITLFGAHQVLRLDRATLATRTWLMPSRERSFPTAVTVDRMGTVWVAEYGSDTIVRLRAGHFETFLLPTRGLRVEAIAADSRGRLWYVGGFGGRLGVIE